MVCVCVMSISGALCGICQTRSDMVCRLSMHLWWGEGSFACVVYVPCMVCGVYYVLGCMARVVYVIGV